MSLVCDGALLSTCGRPLAPFLPFLPVVLTRTGLSYLTSELCGGIIARLYQIGFPGLRDGVDLSSGTVRFDGVSSQSK